MGVGVGLGGGGGGGRAGQEFLQRSQHQLSRAMGNCLISKP